MEHLARALLMRGAREPALMLLRAACRRGGEERARCAALLAAVESRPSDRVSGPPISIDASLVEALASAGRLEEARALALGGDVTRSVAGAEIAAALEEVFAPCEDWPQAWRRRWNDALASGSAPALAAIEREASVAREPPPVLGSRARLALRLLRGFSLTGNTEIRELDGDVAVPWLDEPSRLRIRARLDASNLGGAVREAHALAFEGAPGAAHLAALLGRLAEASDRAQQEPARGAPTATLPLDGHGLALFQLRMGNVEDSLQIVRARAAEGPDDLATRELLTDLEALARALRGDLPAAAETPPPRATGALDKRGRRAGAGGWAPAKAPPSAADWGDDESTSVMKADREAELHVEAGHLRRALELYEQLCREHPERPQFAARRRALEATLAQRGSLTPEPTLRLSPSELARVVGRPLAGTSPAPGGTDPGAFDDLVHTDVTPAGRGIAALAAPRGQPLRTPGRAHPSPDPADMTVAPTLRPGDLAAPAEPPPSGPPVSVRKIVPVR
jgi:hypothetical protein